jgi:hypothetical protein
MWIAGAASGLLGIGSGALKVVAMDQVMRLPFRVSTTTSNFMIGVTAAASAGVYLSRGYFDPSLAFPVILGVVRPENAVATSGRPRDESPRSGVHRSWRAGVQREGGCRHSSLPAW